MIVNPPQAINFIIASVNFFLNAGFETGDFTSWITGGTPITEVGVATGAPHTGTYGAYMYKSNGTWGSIAQNFSNVPVNAITAFTLWATMYAGTEHLDCIVTYSDATSTTIDLTPLPFWVYTQFNILPSLTAGKLVSNVRVSIQAADTISAIKWVDDFDLQVPVPRKTVLLTYPPQS